MKLALLLLGLLCLPATTLAARPPRTEAEALTRRVSDLAAAAGLSPDQATTVFAQLMDPPLAPTFLEVVDERLPDGTRNVFALVRVDPDLECRLYAGTAADCSTGRGRNQDLLFIQVAPDGRVHRTARTTPFTVLPTSSDQIARPVSLRLFAPRPGAASVVVVEGTDVSPARFEAGGLVEPATFTYLVAVWNGRTRIERELALAAPGGFFAYANERLATLTQDPDGHRLIVRELSCEDGCRCQLPGDLPHMKAQLERLAARVKACHATEHALPLPPDLRLVDDDLDALIPRLSRAEALAARPAALAQAADLSLPEATALLARLTTFGVSPRFSMADTRRGPDGTRHLTVLVTSSNQTECIYLPRHRSLYDAVRACADQTGATHSLLQARLTPAGTLDHATLNLASLTAPVALHHLGLGLVGVETAMVNGGVGHRFYSHELIFKDEGRYAGMTFVGRLGDAPNEATRRDRHLGVLDAVPGPDGFVRLALNRAPCGPACPCAAMPSAPDAESALVHQRATHPDPACRPVSTAVAPSPPR